MIPFGYVWTVHLSTFVCVCAALWRTAGEIVKYSVLLLQWFKRNDLPFFGTRNFGLAGPGTGLGPGLAWLGLAWLGLGPAWVRVRLGLAWLGLAWLGLVW